MSDAEPLPRAAPPSPVPESPSPPDPNESPIGSPGAAVAAGMSSAAARGAIAPPARRCSTFLSSRSDFAFALSAYCANGDGRSPRFVHASCPSFTLRMSASARRSMWKRA